jgi:predicted HicB family RNase H-like nuclease
MTTVKYKDYLGSVEFEDGQLVIQVLYIDDFVTTECVDASKVQEAFERLVDEYLDTCAKVKKEPNKPFKGSFNIRMTPELHRRCAIAAGTENLSLNAWMVRAAETQLADMDDESAIGLALKNFEFEENVHQESFQVVKGVKHQGHADLAEVLQISDFVGKADVSASRKKSQHRWKIG